MVKVMFGATKIEQGFLPFISIKSGDGHKIIFEADSVCATEKDAEKLMHFINQILTDPEKRKNEIHW